MPNFDRTGPQGQGPMTGRGMGRCGNGNGTGVGFGRGRGWGSGFGRGRGFGLGWRRATVTDEKTDAQNYIKDLEAELKDTKDYLASLKDKE